MKEHPAVDLEHVTRSYRRDDFEVLALDDVSMQISEQSFVAIMDLRDRAKPRCMGHPQPGSASCFHPARRRDGQRDRSAARTPRRRSGDPLASTEPRRGPKSPVG